MSVFANLCTVHLFLSETNSFATQNDKNDCSNGPSCSIAALFYGLWSVVRVGWQASRSRPANDVIHAGGSTRTPVVRINNYSPSPPWPTATPPVHLTVAGPDRCVNPTHTGGSQHTRGWEWLDKTWAVFLHISLVKPHHGEKDWLTHLQVLTQPTHLGI